MIYNCLYAENIMLNLKKQLFDNYSGFSDKRIKNLEKSNHFIIDDRNEGDYDAKGELFLWFCAIFAEVKPNDEIKLTLKGNLPRSQEIDELISNNKSIFELQNDKIDIHISSANYKVLYTLSNLTSSIVLPGKRYSVPSYKYICPRTASSLVNFADLMGKYYNT